MDDLELLSLAELLDLLVEQTSYHIHLITIGATVELFRSSTEILQALQQEIRLRNLVISE